MRHACTELRPLEQVPRCWRRPCATDRHALAADRSAGRKRGSAHALWSESWRHTVLHVQSLHPEPRKVNVAANGLRIGRMVWPGLGRRGVQSRGTAGTIRGLRLRRTAGRVLSRNIPCLTSVIQSSMSCLPRSKGARAPGKGIVARALGPLCATHARDFGEAVHV